MSILTDAGFTYFSYSLHTSWLIFRLAFSTSLLLNILWPVSFISFHFYRSLLLTRVNVTLIFIAFAVFVQTSVSSTAVAVLLGCAVEDPKMATEFLPLLFVPQLLFAGFFVRTDLIPKWLQWAQYLCSLTYGVRLALLAEFGDCAADNSFQPNLCANLLNVNQINPDEKQFYWGILWGLFIAFRLSGLVLLRKKATKFY